MNEPAVDYSAIFKRAKERIPDEAHWARSSGQVCNGVDCASYAITGAARELCAAMDSSFLERVLTAARRRFKAAVGLPLDPDEDQGWSESVMPIYFWNDALERTLAEVHAGLDKAGEL